jgi:uncharacterized membrane protein (DUF4010 family)
VANIEIYRMLGASETLAVPPLLAQVGIAIAIGALIGLERERQPSRKFAGLRTMALLCAGGPVSVFVAEAAGGSTVMAVVLGLYLGLAVAVALGVAVVRFVFRGEELGFTTSVTVVLVALLGLLVGLDFFVEAASIAILTTVVLAERDRLHGYVQGLTDEELRDSLKLGALVFVLYPVLPAEAVDPYGVVVLREVLLFAIFVLLIQFTAYILMRTVGGSMGLAVTGLLAGAANSFAAAGVLADVANRSRAALDAASFALLLATLSMILRNVGIAVVLGGDMLPLLAVPAAVMVGVTLVAAALLWVTGETHDEFDIDMDSPFSFGSAAKFSVAYIAILLLSVGAEAAIGDAGLYATAFAGGLVSSAAVAVTAATVLTEGTVAVETAVGMVVVGIAASLMAKIGLLEVTNRTMRYSAGVPMGAVGLAGLAAVLVRSSALPLGPALLAGVVLALGTGVVTLLLSWGRTSPNRETH